MFVNSFSFKLKFFLSLLIKLVYILLSDSQSVFLDFLFMERMINICEHVLKDSIYQLVKLFSFSDTFNKLLEMKS